jgi:hypothetical protein
MIDGKTHLMVDPWAYSGAQERFLISALDFGKYQLVPEPTDDYPMFPFCFYDSAH